MPSTGRVMRERLHRLAFVLNYLTLMKRPFLIRLSEAMTCPSASDPLLSVVSSFLSSFLLVFAQLGPAGIEINILTGAEWWDSKNQK